MGAALLLLKQMRRTGIQPDVVTYNAAISACEKGGKWEKALSLHKEMRGDGLKPNVISYSAAISACQKGTQLEEALSLLEEMCEEGIKPNVVTYTALIQACASAGQSITALEIFEKAQRHVNFNIITYNAILDAICKSHPAKSRQLYCDSRSLYGAVEGIDNGNPTLDLRNHSEGAGETALRWWLQERVPEMTRQPEQLIVITGWGKLRRAIENGDLRGRVEGLLSELRAPTLPSDNQGCFLWTRRRGGASRRAAMTSL